MSLSIRLLRAVVCDLVLSSFVASIKIAKGKKSAECSTSTSNFQWEFHFYAKRHKEQRNFAAEENFWTETRNDLVGQLLGTAWRLTKPLSNPFGWSNWEGATWYGHFEQQRYRDFNHRLLLPYNDFERQASNADKHCPKHWSHQLHLQLAKAFRSSVGHYRAGKKILPKQEC